MILTKWSKYRKGAMRGFVTVQLDSGLMIPGSTVLIGKHGPFVQLPSRPVIDADGRQKRDSNGAPIWEPLIRALSQPG